MQIIFESRDPEGSLMRDTAERRLRFVLRRLTWLVPRATLHLSDVNGPRGGIDKCCQVELKTEHAGTVVIVAKARDWRSAIDDALARAARAVLRAWRRSQEQARPRGRAQEAALQLNS
jgi:ribosome-associated translation inhibitor RaiA